MSLSTVLESNPNTKRPRSQNREGGAFGVFLVVTGEGVLFTICKRLP